MLQRVTGFLVWQPGDVTPFLTAHRNLAQRIGSLLQACAAGKR
jgi:hypothetical protein